MVIETGNIKIRLTQTQFARNSKSALLLQIIDYVNASRAGVAVSECHTTYISPCCVYAILFWCSLKFNVLFLMASTKILCV